MKKHFFVLPFFTFLAAALFTSCSSSDDDIIGGTDPVKPEPKVVYFTAQLGGKGSNGGSSSAKALSPLRVVTDPDDGTLDAEWNTGEKVALIYNGVMAEATVTSVSSGLATISATLTEGSPADGMDVKLVYPAAAADVATESGIKADYLNTGQDGTLTTLSAKYDVAVADGKLKVDGTNGSLQEMVALKNQYAICKFTFTQSGTAITGINTLKVGDITVCGTNLSSVYVAFDPSVSGVKKFTVISNTAIYTGSASPSLAAGKFYRPTLNLNKLNHDFVDLGLSVKWATMNVGASSPEEYGDFFAWGETQGYSSVYANPMTDHSFDGASYKWMTAGQSDWIYITKYTFRDDHTEAIWYKDGAFVGDNKKKLDPEDDAATANWGSSWRMPTHAELKELINNTINEWGTLNGVNGRYFYKKDAGGNKVTDTYIFLPAAGYRSGTRWIERGSYGTYWSSELHTNNSRDVWRLYNYSDGMGADNGDSRFHGLSVRAVLAQ